MCRVEFPVSHLQSNTWAVTREFGGRLGQRARGAGGSWGETRSVTNSRLGLSQLEFVLYFDPSRVISAIYIYFDISTTKSCTNGFFRQAQSWRKEEIKRNQVFFLQSWVCRLASVMVRGKCDHGQVSGFRWLGISHPPYLGCLQAQPAS